MAFLVRLGLALALLLGGFATFVGGFAWIRPEFDHWNHVRPATLLGFIVVAAVATVLASRGVRRLALMGAAVNLALLALPLIWTAASVPRSENPSRQLRLVSWNVNADNPDIRVGAERIAALGPDVVLLQELLGRQAIVVSELLGERYPHKMVCQPGSRCSGAIFSRLPLSDTERTPIAGSSHGRLAATVEKSGQRIRIASLHLQYPGDPEGQARHIDQLLGEVRRDLAFELPYVIAGDFNLTPWSFFLTRFTVQTGLRRHTFHRTWPNAGQPGVPFPLFPIDHVFSTPNVRTIAISTADFASSDHMMILAELEMPAP